MKWNHKKSQSRAKATNDLHHALSDSRLQRAHIGTSEGVLNDGMRRACLRGMEKHPSVESPPPSSEQARERHADLSRNLERIVALRDDLRVRAHLLSMDLKEEWDKKISPVFFELEEKAKDVLRHLEAFSHRAKETPPLSSRH